MNYLKLRLLIVSLIFSLASQAQLPKEVLVGYWHNWETLRLKDINNYRLINYTSKIELKM